MDVRLDVKALMQDMGEKARAAASELAFAPAAQKDAALRAAADAIWARARGAARGQRRRHGERPARASAPRCSTGSR